MKSHEYHSDFVVGIKNFLLSFWNDKTKPVKTKLKVIKKERKSYSCKYYLVYIHVYYD